MGLEISEVSRQAVLSSLCVLLGYSIFGIFALGLRFPFDFPVEFYWLSFVFVSIPLFYEAIFWKGKPKRRLFYLLSFSLMINLQYAVVDFSPLLTSSDAVADYRLTDKIITETHWRPFEPVEWFFGSEYRFYPVTNFIYATFSMLTGMPLLLVIRYLFVVKALVVPPLLDKFFRSFFGSRVAYLATVFFLSSPGAIVFPHKESFAMIFFVLGLYASGRIMKKKQYLSIGLVSIMTIVMTHHFTTYVLLGILTSLYLAGYVFESQKTARVSAQFFMLSVVSFVAWIWFVAWTVFSGHQKLLSELFFGALLPGEVALSELVSLGAPYERIIIFVGYGITAISAGLGFLSYVKNKKSRSSGFLAITSFLLLLLAGATIFRFTGSRLNILVSHRAYEFGYIFVGALSALFFVYLIRSHVRKKLTLNLILICSLVLVMIVGPMAGNMHPRSLAGLGKVVSFNGLSLNAWMSESGASDEYTVGDITVQLILSGYGNSMTVRALDLFASQNLSLPADASYVATYVYMTDFYGTNASKFDDSPCFHNLYTNGILNVYRISNRTSP